MTDFLVHPVADLFPMLADDELADLAEDIKQRGLLHPVVLDAEGRVLDGRNRMAACRLLGIEPSTETYDGDDPDGYALSVNIARRHLTRGQQAMIAAKAGRVLQQNTVRAAAADHKVSAARLSYATTVAQHAPDLVDAVITGATGLDEAYRVARDRKTAADSAENQLAKLRAEDPELADKVVEGDLSMRGAFAELAERQRKRADEQRDARALLARVVELLAPTSRSAGFVETWAAQLGEPDAELAALLTRTADARAVLDDLIERTGR